MSDHTADIIVIGNGVLGLSTAVALLRRDPSLAIAVVGDKTRPAGATPAAGAMFGCFGEVTAASMRTAYGRARLGHAMEARAAWPDWLEFISDTAGVDGSLITADSTNIILNTVGYSVLDTKNYKAILSALRENEEPHDEIDPEEIEWLQPLEPSRPLKAIHIPREGSVNADLLLRALARGVEVLGGKLVDAEVKSLHQEENSARVAVTLHDGTTLKSESVVLCTGARLTELLTFDHDLSLRVPRMTAGVGFSAIASLAEGNGPSSVIRTPNRAFACGLHVVPRGNGKVYMGATNAIELSPRLSPSIDELLFLFQCATEQVNVELNWATVDALQAGNRPVSIDGQPLVGRTSIRGLWVLAGTYRDGLHCSPVYADRMAEAILTDADFARGLEVFAPERDLLDAGSRDDVISDVVDNTMATGYERPWRLPSEWPMLIEHMTRESFKAFCDSVSEHYTPPADILTTLRFSPDSVQADFVQYYKDVYAAWH